MRGVWILLASLALASAEKCSQHKTKSTCDNLDCCLWSEHSSSCVYTKETDDDPTADVDFVRKYASYLIQGASN